MEQSARYGVSYEQVAAAADALTAEGLKPTLRGVRERIGTGSMPTIQRHLATWRSQGREIAIPNLTLSEGTQRAILMEVERQVAEARSKLEEDLAIARGDRDALTEEGERQNERLATQEAEIERLRSELHRQTGTLEQLKKDLDQARETARTETAAAKADGEKHRLDAQELRQQLARAELRLEALPRIEADMTRLQGELKAEREGGRLVAQAAAVAAERIQGLESRLADFQKRDEDSLKQTSELRTALEAERIKSADAEKVAAVSAEKVAGLELFLAELEKRPRSPPIS